MTTIKVPRSFADILEHARESVQLVDEQGKVLGSFSPAIPINANDELTVQEIDSIRRRRVSGGRWFTTQEVLAHLQSLEKG